MNQPDVRTYLRDILQACDLITEFTANMSIEEYRSSALAQSAVERQFLIIGEALRLVLAADPELQPRISAAAKIIAFRNRLAHGYSHISTDVVWGALQGPIPKLRNEVGALLAEPETPDQS